MKKPSLEHYHLKIDRQFCFFDYSFTSDSNHHKIVTCADHLYNRFIILGLNYLIDHLFIVAARNIKVVNTAGVEKIKRNIMSLQQFLGSAGASDDALSRSMTYWDLYNKGPKVSRVPIFPILLATPADCAQV